LYRWSPQQIAAKLRHMHPDDPTQRVSHETIYASIYASIYAHPRGGTAEAALEGFSRQLKKFPSEMRASMTYDRGSEMTCYAELMDRLDMDVWFADPHAPWQRGSNENTNGLLRQFLPKGADLSVASQEYLNHVAWLMNTRPRQTLSWKTPAEVMDIELHAFRSRVAIAS